MNTTARATAQLSLLKAPQKPEQSPFTPKRCYRARLTRELFEMKARGEFAGVPMSFAHFKGTDACSMTQKETR